MIKEAIIKLIQKKNLTYQEAKTVFEEILDKKATTSQIAGFLVALSTKRPTQQEITAAASVIRDKAIKLNVKEEFMGKTVDEPIFDTCGTGGSGVKKFNISTAVAFVVSSAGIKVAKHGNRAMTSLSGSADVLEQLGIKIDVQPQIMQEAIKKIGIGFLYAPLYHPALKEVAQIRREIGVRTIFNILGPLCNPAGATHQLLGVFDKDLARIIALVLKNLGTKKAFVVHSEDLKDEVSLSSKTIAYFLNKNRIQNFLLTHKSFGLNKIKLKDIEVNSPQESAGVFKEVIEAKKGPCFDIVLANSAVCFFMLGKAKDLKDATNFARGLLESGVVKKKFIEFKEFIQKNA